MKHIFIFLISICFTLNCLAQQLTAKVVDANNNPIPFATIQTGEQSGVITNEEGVFTINYDQDSSVKIKISSLGFTSVSLSIDEINNKNNIIILDEYIEELQQVYVSNIKPDANLIIQKVNEHLSKNYKYKNKSYNLFFRNTSLVDFNTLEFEIDKVSGQRRKELTDANNALKTLTNSIQTSEAVFYRDYIANLHVQDKDNKKLDVLKGTTLLDKNRSFSIDAVQEKAQNLILQYLDTTYTYKLKSGLFKIEDSLSLKNEELKKQHEDSVNTFSIKSLKSESFNLLSNAMTYEQTLIHSILNTQFYDYSFDKVTVFDENLVYVISYTPRKSKAKYTGKLYITDEDFAVIKLDYRYAEGKRGQKVNLKFLLGVKYLENIKTGTILYKKNQDSIYQLHYISQKTGSLFYVNRPLKLIENSEDRKKI